MPSPPHSHTHYNKNHTSTLSHSKTETTISSGRSLIQVHCATKAIMNMELEKETTCAEENFHSDEVKLAGEPICMADASSVDEQTSEQVLTKKKKKKLAAQEKMRALELQNAELKEQARLAEEKLASLEEDMSSSLQAEIKSSREGELEKLLEAAELSAMDNMEQISSLREELEGLQGRMMKEKKLKELLMSAELELENLRASESQLKEEIDVKGSVEEELRSHQEQVFKLQEELAVTESKKESVEEAFEQMRDRCIDLESELRLCREELGEAESVATQKNLELQALQESESKLESAMSQSLRLKSELEEELRRFAEAERRANIIDARNQELEDLVQSSQVKVEESGRRMSELEAFLEMQNSRAEDLEQEMGFLARKCDQAEAASIEKAVMVSAMITKLEAAAENERRLEESLSVITEEKRKSEEALHDSVTKLQEAENLLEVLKGELIANQGKLESFENVLKEAGIRENEMAKIQECAEAQLQQLMEKFENKDSEARSLCEKLENVECKYASSMNTNAEIMEEHARLTVLQSETEARFLQEQVELNEAIRKLTCNESEGRELVEKCSKLEDQVKIHEASLSELSEIAESRKAELDLYFTKVSDQEKMIEEFEAKLGRVEMNAVEMTEANAKLNAELAESQSKMIDLQEEISSSLAEKDYAVENFKASVKANEDLIKELSSDRQSFQCIMDSMMEEKQLLSEASIVAENGLQTLIADLDRQLKEHKESNGALKDASEDMRLQATQNSALLGRVEELEEQCLEDEARHRQEIASIMEGKKLYEEATNPMAENESQTLIAQLEEQLVEYKEGNEALLGQLEIYKNQAILYSAFQTRVMELEQMLLATEAQFVKEVENIQASADAREAELISKAEQILQLKEENMKMERVEQIAENYSLEPVIYKTKGDGPCEVGSNIQTPKKEKTKKPGKSSAASFHINNMKLAAGIGLVSVIAGILSGKK